jgi:molybdopterin-guanine dinucleotide biosynthesis protein A
MTTFRQAETGYIEALTSIYEPDCLPLFSQAIGMGRRQINLIIPPARRHDIVYAKSEARPFLNINYPADIEQAHIWANSQAEP